MPTVHEPPAGDGDGLARTVPAEASVTAPARSQAVVCVHNLSRFAQPAELQLAAWAGWRPVEVLGRVPFPVIGEEPYTLTLAPHGFVWFELTDDPAQSEDVEP